MSVITPYLSSGIADYTDEIITLPPDGSMITTGQMNQISYEFDDGVISVTTLSGSIFNIEIQWSYLTFTEAQTLIDLYHDPTKANGMARTWYLQDPIENTTYIVRFISSLVSKYEADKYGVESFPPIKLRVVGIMQEITWDGIIWDGIVWA